MAGVQGVLCKLYQQAVPFAVELVRDAEVKCVLKMNR